MPSVMFRYMLCAALLGLMGCGGGETQGAISVPLLANMGDVATGGTTGSNGLDFAQDGDTHVTVEDQATIIKVARIIRDPDSRVLSLDVSDQLVTLNPDFFEANGGAVLFLGGEQYVLDENVGAIEDMFYAHYGLFYTSIENGHRVEIYLADNDTDEVWERGFYIIGTQTDPVDVAALTGMADYTGAFQTFGFARVEDGNFSEFFSVLSGDMTLSMDFDADSLSGTIENGTYSVAAGSMYEGTFEATIGANDITGNGAAGVIVLENCAGALSCTSSNSQLAGNFFADDGAIFSGITAMQETFENEGGDAIELIAVGNFALEHEP